MKEFLVALLVFLNMVSCETVSGSDFSPRIRSVAASATSEIRKLKQYNGEHDKCTDLSADIISARTESVKGESGIKYSLQLRVSPTRVDSKHCDRLASSKSARNIWQPELCDVEMLEKPWRDDVTIVRSACLKIED